MRDVNPRSRERFDLSLDGRQIASIVVGAIVVLAVVFVLGLNVGKQVARREAQAAAGAGNALEALDQAAVQPPAPVKDESLTYHDRLVKERPAAAAPEAPRPPPEPAPAAAEPTPVAAPTPEEPPPPPAAPAPVAAQPSAPPQAPAVPARPAPAAEPAGDWSVQVGAAEARAEAERIASKFERFNPRIETAVIQGKTWHRVRVGAFATKAAAEKYLKDLARETGAKGYVTNSR